MNEQKGLQPQSASSHIVEYNRDAPSPEFSREHIDYVESISSYLSSDELAAVRQLEWLIFNRNSEAYGYSFVPGLRGDASFMGSDEGCLYVKRFSKASYARMMDLFMAHVPEDFPNIGSGGNMPGFRVTLPNGDRFYPIAFFGDLSAWRRRLQETAALHRTELAHFDRGKFVVSDGQGFDFCDLRVEALETHRYPKSW